MALTIDNVPDDDGQTGVSYGKEKNQKSEHKQKATIFLTKEQARQLKVGDKVKLSVVGEVERVGAGYATAIDGEPEGYETCVTGQKVESIEINTADKTMEAMMGKSK
ncbi:MAG: hypothetical protein EKK55_17370 [Rhodocyclaceae bacterium]|nr:MAG: hypothetical protein EKK55_17370 [Rhodocyclaceae bacterium]